MFHFDTAAKVKSRTYWTLGISTPEQRLLAWQYGHQRLVLVDGTFNICDKYGIVHGPLNMGVVMIMLGYWNLIGRQLVPFSV